MDPTKIARQLTIPQREVLLDLNGEWAPAPRCQIGDVNPPQTRACKALVCKGLLERQGSLYRLTELGEAVSRVKAQ